MQIQPTEAFRVLDRDQVFVEGDCKRIVDGDISNCVIHGSNLGFSVFTDTQIAH